ncbi:MAG: hypothetical protein CVT94_03025 [Bacteroidetes bacterium HGW-Bacteroidetes-11]|jgi:hypothetical protein|nr:MAG: hypothetical protein CVT94_03025 [Bacteroidetes bacterium HGW-Bacteroidetes-11]
MHRFQLDPNYIFLKISQLRNSNFDKSKNNCLKIDCPLSSENSNKFAASMQQVISEFNGARSQWITGQVETQPAAIDSIASYAGFLADSLNPDIDKNEFRFELKEIIFADTTAQDTAAKNIYPSIILPFGSRTQEIKPVLRTESNNDWITFFLFLSVALLAWVRFYYPRRLKQIFYATFVKRYISQLVRDGNIASERITPALGFIALISTTTLIYGLIGNAIALQIGRNSTTLSFLLIGAVLILIWFLRRFIVKSSGRIFKSAPATEVYLLNSLLFPIVTGVIIFPIVIAWFFAAENYFLYLAGGIVVISMTIRFLRNLSGGLQSQSFSAFYIFLYFCTLEILPLAIVYKIYTILLW